MISYVLKNDRYEMKVPALTFGAAGFERNDCDDVYFEFLDKYVELGGWCIDTTRVYCDWLENVHDSSEGALMDGGRGQVNIALQVLDELHLNIAVCGMVKDDHHRTRGLYYNNIEIPIDRDSEAFRLITRIQDEAHRFAIEYHRQLRGKGQVHSVLDDIPGIGSARRKALMRHFLSLDAIRDASVEELAKIPSMNQKAAESVYEFLH